MDLKEAGIEDEVIEILKKNEITTIEEFINGSWVIVGLGKNRQILALYKVLRFMQNKNKTTNN